jgi:hypothetical protein
MAAVTYEDVLRDARQLHPEEQQRLRDALDMSQGARVVAPAELRALLANGIGAPRPLSDEERAAVDTWLAETEQLAVRIGAAWKSDLNAVEAVQEQRRDL